MRFLLLMMMPMLLPVAVAGQVPAQTAEAAGAPLTDIVIDGFDRPLRMRLVVTRDGIAWREHFNAKNQRRVRSMFDQLDADGDQRLSGTEAKRLPSPRSLGGRPGER